MIDRGEPYVPADAAAWRRVRRGLTCLLLAVGVLVAACAAAAGLHFVSKAEGWRPFLVFGLKVSPAEAALAAGLAVHLGFLIAGQVLCATAPRRRGARRFGVLCLTCFVGTLAALSGYLFPPPLFNDQTGEVLHPALAFLASLLALGYSLSFCYFLRGVAAALEAGYSPRHLTELTAAVATVGSLITALLGFALFVPPDPIPRSLVILFLFGCLLGPFSVGVFGWFLFSVLKARAAVAAHLAGGRVGRV
jgi:hypothetical protein